MHLRHTRARSRVIWLGGLLCVALVLLSAAAPVLLRAAPPATIVFLPVILRDAPAFAGQWDGVATQAGNVFDYTLNLTNAGSTIRGTATIRERTGSASATMLISGTQLGSSAILDEGAVTQSSGTPSGGRWCIKTLLLRAEDGGGQFVRGTWKEDGCNTGRVYLARSASSIRDVSGRWQGTFTQGSTVYTTTLTLATQGDTVTGLADVAFAGGTGALRVQGAVVGDWMIAQETEVLTSSGPSWCKKTIEARWLPTSTDTITGTWSAVGCVGGTIVLRR